MDAGGSASVAHGDTDVLFNGLQPNENPFGRRLLGSQVHTPTNYNHLHKKTKAVIRRSQSNQASPYLAMAAVVSVALTHWFAEKAPGEAGGGQH